MYSPYHSVSCDWGELSVNAVDLEYAEAVTSVQFDGLQEVVWAGTSMGRVNTFLTPLLEPYACWPAHTGSVTGILPLPGTDCALTVGREAATLSTNGGLRKAGIRPGLQADNTQASFGGCCFEPSTRGQSIPQAAIMGLLSGGLMHWDLNTSKVLVMNKECLGTEGVSHLCGPVGRGGSLLAAGLRTGRLVLLDCRTPRSLKLEPGAGAVGVAAHTGGFTAMDARGDYVACCGYSMRGSHAQPDAYMKVFDMRNLGGSTLKPMLTLPFPNISGAPTSLSFHPKMHSLLLVGSGRGGLNMVDIAKGTSISTHQVTYDGSGLGSVCIAPTGEAWLLGDATSCVRLWSESDTPRCHTVPNYTEVPPAYAMPSVEIGEEDSFASVPQYPLASMELGASYLSDLAPNATMSIGQPPRIIDPSILKQVRQVDFIGHHPNPKYVRGAPYGQATAAVAQLRNMRVPMVSIKPPPVAANKSEKKKRTGPILPRKFKRVEIRVQAGLKFEEFNFASFNCTRFAGLENDLPNSYANALLQVLYFTPGLRTALLHHVPEPDSEFCLACELGLLFRCMAASHGKPCQAANLLRALRQIREAAALGLLDSSSSLARVGAHGGQAHEETLARRWALGRRVAALARFLMDHCHKEASPKAHPECSSHNRSGIVPQPVPTNAALGPLLERLAALPHTVRLKCLGGSREEKTREDRVFQVDLQYPMEREKAARLAADAANLGFNKIPEAAAAVLRSAAPTRSHAAPAASIEPNSEAEGRRQQQQQHQQQQQLPLGEGQESVPQQPQQQQGQPQLQDQEQKQQQNGKEGQQGQGSAASTAAAAAAAAAGAGNTSNTNNCANGSGSSKPLFSELLQRSMLAVSDTRAWFSEKRGYAMVRQSRLPTALPQVLAIDCSIKNASDIAWWLPDPACRPAPSTSSTEHQNTSSSERGNGTLSAGQQQPHQQQEQQQGLKQQGPKQQQQQQQQQGIELPADRVAEDIREAKVGAGHVPWALRVEVLSEQQDLRVVEGGCVEELLGQQGKGASGDSSTNSPCAVYALSAMICHIQDADEEDTGATSSMSERQAAAASAAAVASRSGAAGGPREGSPDAVGSEGHLVSLIRVPRRYWDEAPLTPSLTQPPLGAASTVYPAPPRAPSPPGGRPITLPTSQAPGSTEGEAGKGEALSHQGGYHRGLGSESRPAEPDKRAEGWLLFNDFAIMPVDRSEVMASYGAQKLPCMVYYSRVDPYPEDDGSLPPSSTSPTDPAAAATPAVAGAARAAACAVNTADTADVSKAASEGEVAVEGTAAGSKDASAGNTTVAAEVQTAAADAETGADAVPRAPLPDYPLPPPLMPPVLTRQQFKQLCLSPPLQGPQPHSSFKFVPLDTSPTSKEAPRPGLLLALDAEFVMVQPPERVFKRSMEVLTRSSRLGLARVSILRGEGPRLGTPCIDDYVRAVEPVFDHLTRYSGLVPGDLEPSTSSHYLTTMKHAYLKLRYLVDCGCVFVGHGLCKDFRMINIYVPPEQLVDTVELFSFKRKRKLSLRFLASYLLGINIQANVHDSVEDARTALRLYLKYRQLVEEGTFQEKLEELYNWGKQYGWEPVVLGKDGKPVPPSTPVMVSL